MRAPETSGQASRPSRRWASACLALAGLFTLAACSETPISDLISAGDRVLSMRFGPSGPDSADLNLIASEEVNPDASGRASPLVIRIYQLQSAQVFRRMDYFELVDEGAALLGDDLLSSHEMVLEPGATMRVHPELHPQTRYLGVVAAYRDLDASRWRDLHELGRRANEPLEIRFSREAVVVAPQVEPRASSGPRQDPFGNRGR